MGSPEAVMKPPFGILTLSEKVLIYLYKSSFYEQNSPSFHFNRVSRCSKEN